MNVVKAAKSPGSSTGTYTFARPVREEPVEVVSKPIETKAAVGKAPIQDLSFAKEEHFLDQIAALEKAIGEKEEEITAAKAEAYEEGLKAGKKEADSKSEAALELLKSALQQNSRTLDDKLEGQVELSLDLARTILRRILGETSDLPSHVISTAAHWKQELAARSALKVRVSAHDFSDQSALDKLQEQLTNVEISPQLDLRPGSCLFDLKLGTVDVSIENQLASAEAFLLQATDEAEAQ